MFGGVWTKYALFELPLFGAEELKLQLGGSTLSIPVIRAQGKPELFAEISREVSDLEGRKTFASIPSVRFTREVKNIEKYEITIYRASKIIFRSLLSELRNENGEFRLNDIFEWETGSYTVRVLGPLGSDLVSAFVFMPNVRLDNLKQNYLPFENATVNLLIDGHPPALMEFPAGEDRITAELELESEVLQFRLRIPRFLFSICEPNDAPDFGSFITETTERDFLEELSNCNLHIRFRDSVKGKVQLGSRNELLHSKPFEIKDGIEVAKIELSDFRQDVQRSKSTSLEISVQLENSAIFTVAKIETEFDGAVKSFEANQVIDGQVTEIVFEIDQSLRKHELQLVLKEMNRPWNGLRIVPINERFCEFTPSGEDTYSVVAKLSEPIVPGKYQTGLAFLDSTKMINNTRNVVQFGTKSDLAIYLKTLNEDGLGIANGAVLGRPIPKRSLSEAEYQSGVNTVGQYLLFNTEAGNNSSEYKYAKEFLLHEGQTSALVSWFCDTLSDRSTKNQAEKLLISIFPQFCDSPLEGDDAQLRQRIWRTSPLVGAAMTYFLETPEVIQERNYWLGPMDDARVPVESYVSTRLSELKKVDQLQFQNQKILSTEYLKHVIIGFILRNSSSERVDALHIFNLEVDELLGDIINKQKAFSTRLQRLEPFQIFTYRNASVLSKIPYNFYQLSLTIVDNSVPYVLADKAAVLLSNQLETGKELVMCSLLSALVETRVKSAQ